MRSNGLLATVLLLWMSGVYAGSAAQGCAGNDASLQREIDALQRALDVHELALERATEKTSALTRSWTRVAARLSAADRDFEAAEVRYAAASRAPARDEAALAQAAAQAERAAERWLWAESLIATAATLDARRMAARKPSARGMNTACRGGMTTASYRALLTARGVSLRGMHIDHIVPRALGGADHPSNYQILRSAENQRFGARWSLAKCMGAGRAACVRAVEVSRACGKFTGGLPKR
jgi:hypothetical protein